MAKTMNALRFATDRRWRGARAVVLLLGTSMFALPAQQDKDKDKPRKVEPAPKPEPKREAPQPKPEPRREAPPQARPEPRREAPAQVQPAPRPEIRRDLPPPTRQEPAQPVQRPEIRRDLPPATRQEPVQRPDPRQEPPPIRHDPAQPRPEQGRPVPPIHSDPKLDPRRDPRAEVPAPRVQPGDRRPGAPPPGAQRGPVPQVQRTPNGGEIQRTPTGAIREVRTPSGAVIRHSPSGIRHVEVARPDGRIVIANATGRSGYIQRPLTSHGQVFIQRTYVFNGVRSARIYRPWSYGGRVYPVYVPVHYYRPSFYLWVHRPWERPVAYHWGWSARPWYGYYGGYFTPYPRYESPAFWLADFLIATTLEAAFLSQNVTYTEAPVVYDASTGMSPEVKAAIADEVRRQMDQERADQAAAQSGAQVSGPPPLFSSNGPRVFLVSGDVMGYAGDRECPLMEGDVLQLAELPPQGSEWAEVRVLSSRGPGVPKGAIISVRTMDLQEMQNHMQATLDQGLTRLQADQGRGGMPAPPAGALGTSDAAYANDLLADDNALDELSLAVKDANRSEQDIISQGGQEPAAGSATVSLGMTMKQVVAALGQPVKTVDLGAKQIYVYSDLKITFLNGRVSDVQ